VFSAAAESYDRFMGRYSVPLARRFADYAGVSASDRVLDVGCGPGALTAELLALGAWVCAVDPSESFAAAAGTRFPEVDVRCAGAEQLPFDDGSFDVALAQLVVHFMADPVAGLREMRRVTRPGGVVAANVWDHGTGRGPLTPVWEVARELDPGVVDEAAGPGAVEGDLTRLFAEAGPAQVEETLLCVTVEHPTFDEWWEPMTYGVGPLGAYVAALDEDARARLRERCLARLGDGPFEIQACAWTARATV
jgi:SAM-dependent methyltransferase